MTSQAKFLKLLKEDILKLDLADLDFGIYRILKYRQDEIEDFLNNRLSSMMAGALGSGTRDRIQEVNASLGNLRTALDNLAQQSGLGSAFRDGELHSSLKQLPIGENYLRAIAELQRLEADAGFTQSEEERLYNHLYTFFSRYYRDGDFLPQTRRSRQAKYSVPYNGEDVHFYWKSWGNHYVKTSEELRTYACLIGDWRVVFELRRAEEEKDNIKGKTRFFIPQVNQAVVAKDSRTYTIPFEFRPLTEKEQTQYEGGKKKKASDGENGNGTHSIQDAILVEQLGKLKKKPPELNEAELLRHMRRYTRKNRTDYFVHRHLGEFLKGEFDYYLKNEFLDLEAFTSPEALQDKWIKLGVLREIGYKLCDLLDQIESYQARLFEKRKFVLGVDYLIPVRLLPSEVIGEVLDNQEQLAAWRELFCLEIDPITAETLATHPTLVIDTRHFEASFKQGVLTTFEDIDAITDGVLINAENYAALRTIEARFKHSVKVIYIDPPYNTGNDEFLYKDDFSRHSTWLTMMEERLIIARDLLADNGVIFISIDDNELTSLLFLMQKIFSDEKIATIVWKGSTDNNPTRIAVEHEYILAFAKDKNNLESVWQNQNDFTKELMLEKFEEIKDQTSDIQERQKLFRDFIRNNRESLNPLTHYDRVDEDGPYTGGRKVHNPGKEGYRYDVKHPKTGKPCKQPARGYRFPETTMNKLLADDKIIFGDDDTQIIQIKEYLKDYSGAFKGIIELDNRVAANTLEALFCSREIFRNPKPVELIDQLFSFTTNQDDIALDFFGGSGTTAHTVIELNRNDGKRRKFLFVEMSEYFDKLVVKRIQKVMYSPHWRSGKPEGRSSFPLKEEAEGDESLPEWIERSPRLVKILHLESFEDSLDGIELPKERSDRIKGQLNLFDTFEDYLVKYLLPTETEETEVLLNLQALEKPFEYCLRLHTPTGTQDVPVDLVETFNLFMGFHVQRLHELVNQTRRYVVVEALENMAPVLVVWRNIADLNPDQERQFLSQQFDLTSYRTIYTNADNALPNGTSLDSEFKRRMNEPERRTV